MVWEGQASVCPLRISRFGWAHPSPCLKLPPSSGAVTFGGIMMPSLSTGMGTEGVQKKCLLNKLTPLTLDGCFVLSRMKWSVLWRCCRHGLCVCMCCNTLKPWFLPWHSFVDSRAAGRCMSIRKQKFCYSWCSERPGHCLCCFCLSRAARCPLTGSQRSPQVAGEKPQEAFCAWGLIGAGAQLWGRGGPRLGRSDCYRLWWCLLPDALLHPKQTNGASSLSTSLFLPSCSEGFRSNDQ